MSVFVEIHALQSVPPSNLNRDDNGSPKTASFGGVKRHRVSSQSWKRAVRQYFDGNDKGENLGFRTSNVARLVANRMLSKNPALDYNEALEKAIAAVTLVAKKAPNKESIDKAKKESVNQTEEEKKKAEKKRQQTDALFLISERQIDNFADILLRSEESKDLKKDLKDALLAHPSLDLALFGRMVASATDLNMEASAQVAHAISTHEVSTEFDFFTAVDDCSVEDNAGAGMMGDVEYTSSTLYRYAVVNASSLAKQFEGDEAIISSGLDRFINAFVRSIPSGKQNTFAARTLPEALLVVVRTDQPTSYANAFEKPVHVSDEGYALESIRRLSKAVKSTNDAYGDEGVLGVFSTTSLGEPAVSLLSEISTLGSLRDTISEAVRIAVNEDKN